ncbi:protein-export chaperone SecB [Prevotella sp. HUN102]|uniref:protein-export chaperone SecB n=1 Tax=Prevotella sp. HUN102 TaxID=1392486 RepID=UPI00048F9907|nr:protein-export chaperone SecB [Prevotella sp. HUN102]
MEKTAFKFDSYHFTKASLDFNIPDEAELNVSFTPKGKFFVKKTCYELDFDVVIECKESNTEVVKVSCKAFFTFDKNVSINDIPDYFYPNSLAIIFPYIRAFVSTLSLQANVRPVVLPTINLMGLTDDLKKHTEVIEE